jgi:hypothetical protein
MKNTKVKNISLLDSRDPNIAYFTKAIGWVELGYDVDSNRSSCIIALDPGGLIWEGRDSYDSLEEAFRDLEEGLGEWMREVGIEPPRA